MLLERDDSLLGCGAIDAVCRTRKIAQLFQTVLDLADVLSLILQADGIGKRIFAGQKRQGFSAGNPIQMCIRDRDG